MASRKVIKKRFRALEGDGWLLTYSDMVTLVLIFFVFLYSLSAIDVTKFKAFIASFQGAGILEWGDSPLETSSADNPTGKNEFNPDSMVLSSPPLHNQIAAERAVLTLYEQVKEYLKQNELQAEVSVAYEKRGVYLDIKEQVLFDSGKADLKPSAMNLLSRLAGLFARLTQDISVEGHTDSRPISTAQFPSNWELSTARATTVLRYIVEKHGLDPARFAAVGYGEFHPLVANDLEDNMALNRRVVIFIEAVATEGARP